MKYLLILLAFLGFFHISSTAQRAKVVKIHGKLGAKGSYTKIYLDSVSQKGFNEFDTSAIRSKGRFKLSVHINRTDIYKLRLDETNYTMLILSPGEKIKLKSTEEKLGMNTSIRGSKHTEILYNAINKLMIFDKNRDSLNKQYNTILTSSSKDSLIIIILRESEKNDSLQKVTFRNLVEANPSSLSWIFLQDRFDMNNDFALVDKTEKAMFTAFPYNVFVQQFHQQLELERKTAIGSLAPDISLPDPDSTLRSLSSLRGKVVLLDFWASWCGPCRKENPNVVEAYRKYHDKGFEVFSVSLDKDRDSWLKAIAMDKLTWPYHVSDLKYWKSAGAAVYGVSSIPYSVLIDREGKIVAKKLRGDALETKLEQLFK
jgi:thiol-disulfide isomerase/thioredoxin